MKTIKTWLTTIVVLLCSIPMNAYDFQVDGIYYNKIIGGRTLEVTNGYYKYYGTIIIPNTVVYFDEEYSVTSIGEKAFYGCYDLTSVTIPNSVKRIGKSAFSGCSGLASVTIGNSVTSIGDYAFSGCSGLASVTIPNSVTTIGVEAFYYCSGLTSVTIPNSVTSIGERAFEHCSGLTSVTIPNSVTSIGNQAFEGCSGLTSVTIPNSVTSIGNQAFRSCSGLTSIVVEDENTVYDSRNNCNAIIETASNMLLCGCQTTVIPNSVTSIGERAFSDCSGLTSVTIPNSVTSIGKSAFDECSGLTSVHISDIAAWCNIDFYEENYQSSNPLRYAHHLYLNGEEVKDLVIPNSVDSIGDYAFSGCSGLTSVTIPNSVTSIGCAAFSGCSGLTSVHMFDIAAWCNIDFDGASSNPLIYAHHLYLNGEEVKDLVIPNSVDSIGDYAFDECSGLTSVIIPNSVDYIGSSAFFNCNRLAVVINLSDLDISRGSKSHGYVAYYAERVYNADEMVGDYAFKESDGKNYLVRYVGDDKSITLPENYKENNYNIGDEAFYGCGFLTSIVIPNNVQVIGNDAFYGCKLSSLTIGTGVRSIGSSSSESNKPKKVFWLPSSCPDGYKNLDGELNYVPNDQYYVSNRKIYPYLSSMFEVNNMKYVPVSPAERTCDLLDCIYDSLGSVVEIEETVSYKGIPMTVQSVGAQTFYGLKNIKEVYVSSSVQKSAFAYCDSLTKVTFGDNAKIIGASAFEGCSSLSDVKNGTNVRSIEDNAFKDCSYLNNIEIADSVENIGVSAFSGCSSLSAIAIPQATETIKSSAFSGCSSLTNVAIEDRTTNLEFGGDVFNKCPLDSVYIGGKINGTPFRVNKSLRSVAFANNVDSIYAEEFYGCSNLKNVAMGDAVSSIGYQAFSGCSSLESFTFASAMKTIGGKAFSGCTSMTSLISLATTPPICGNLALDDIDKWSCVLKVPESSISAYQAADGWKEFFFIESLPTAITEVTEDENLRNATDVYTIGGMKVTSSGKLAKGIYIVDGKKVIVD